MKINDILSENDKWLNNVKNVTPNPKYDPNYWEDSLEYFNILVNGERWIKDGKPVEFDSREKAEKAKNTISTKYGKIAQVVPAINP